MKGKRIRYSAGELAFVKENFAMPKRDLASLLCSRFHRDDITAEHLKRLCLRRGWVTVRKWWTPAEDALIRRLYPNTPTLRIAEQLDRSRDRRRKPDLRIEPPAPCARCGVIEGRQTFRQGRSVGKHGVRNQYWYTCPSCRDVVMPFYFCALNAIDFSIPATRIGDRPPAMELLIQRVVQFLAGTRSLPVRAP